MVLRRVRDTLADAGIDTADLDARHLVRAIGPPKTDILCHKDQKLDAAQAQHLAGLVEKRAAHMPLAQVLGRWEFWSLDLFITKDVLTPRPQSEHLIEAVLQRTDKAQKFNLVDLGTGSGALMLAILSERPAARAVGVDLSPDALKIAQKNAVHHNMQKRTDFVLGGWDAALAKAPFDVLVSNPPYIARREIAGLHRAVRDYEPHMALDGGADGLDAYRQIFALVPHYVRSGGVFAFEIGADQGAAVLALARAMPALRQFALTCDYGGRDRILAGRVC